MIGILNSGAANIRSVENALKRLSVDYFVSDQEDELSKADKIIFPGVGHAAAIMQNLYDKNLVAFIQTWQQPFLGICLGMQVLFEFSAEGNTKCLGIIPGQVRKFDAEVCRKIPQMGWNTVNYQLAISNEQLTESREQRIENSKQEVENEVSRKDELFTGIKNNDFFYFVHSYMAPVSNYTVATTEYGELFSAVVNKDNYWGVQFHPEKSGEVGEQLLKNFCLI